MVNQRLYELLADSYAKPSGAYTDFQSAALAGATIGDAAKKYKIEKQLNTPLSQILGEATPTELKNARLRDISADSPLMALFKIQSDNAAVPLIERVKDPNDGSVTIREIGKVPKKSVFADVTIPSATGSSGLITPAQNTALMSGDPNQINAAFPDGIPVGVARLGVQSRGQSGVASRFTTKLDQGKKEKGAKAEMDSGKSLENIQEARNTIDLLQAEHAKLVDSGLAGDPVRKGLYTAASTVTGGAGKLAPFKGYASARNGMVTRLKSVTGNVGMVTEFDQARLEALTPDLGESKEAVAAKSQIINNILDLGERGEMARLDTYLRKMGLKTTDAQWDKEGRSAVKPSASVDAQSQSPSVNTGSTRAGAGQAVNPDPRTHKGKYLTDPQGNTFRSDGANWVPYRS